MVTLIGNSLRLSYGVDQNRVHAVRDATVNIRSGELTLLTGLAGSGKTSLLYLLGCVLLPDAGEVLINGEAVSSLGESARVRLRCQNIGFIFQECRLFQSLTVLQNVAIAVQLEQETRSPVEVAIAALQQVGMEEKANLRIEDLSSGEQKRLAIARAIARNPRMLLADEPAGPLSERSSKQIAELLVGFAHEDRVVTVASRDAGWMVYARRRFHIEDGRVL